MNDDIGSEARCGFSLIEVVVATAIFAASIVAVIGLMGPMTKRAEDVIDAEIAARLSASIQSELERVGFATAVTLVPPITLFANPDGTVVRLGSGSVTPLPVDRAPNDVDLPGIANRDRHFRITLSEVTGLTYVVGTSAALSLRADVEWPYWIPEGPATPNAPAVSTDPHAEVPEAQRQRMSYFFAVRP